MSRNKPLSVVLLLIWCLFMGITTISIGFGAIFPPLNAIAQPFVCANGQLQLLTSTSHPQPGVTYTAEDWQCVDNQTQQAHDVNEWSMFLINGLIYGTILFAIIVLWRWLAARRRARRIVARATVEVPPVFTPQIDLPPGGHANTLDAYELHELTRMYKEGKFSEREYQRKRRKILDRMANQTPAESSAAADTLAMQTMTPYAATSTAGSASTSEIESKLSALKKLRDEGLITEQDYEQKKLEILSRM